MTAKTANTIPTLNASERKLLTAYHDSWPLSILPDVVKPYAELIRIHKPAGIMMFYFPCLYGTFLVGCLGGYRAVRLGARTSSSFAK